MSYITGSLNLAALKYVIMEQKGKSGMVKGMFIPIEANKLTQHDSGGVYLNLIAFEMKEGKEWATHILKQSLSKDEREAMTEEEQQAMPLLGNLKVGGGTPVGADNNAAEGETLTEDSEVPF